MSDKNHEFIVRFEGVNLSKEASQRIQNKIGDILTQELGGQVSGAADGDDVPYCGIYIPRLWHGRYILPVDLNKGVPVVRADAKLAVVGSVQALAR